MVPSIAIIDRNPLSMDALGEILHELFPLADVLRFQSIDAYFSDGNRHYVLFFVSEDVMMANVDEFETLRKDTIVLCQGAGNAYKDAGFKVINVFQPVKDIVGDIINLVDTDEDTETRRQEESKIDLLSAREKEVLALMVKGLYNKEIADKLNISTATAIFHRNNVCDKLGTRSIGRLTVAALLANLVSIDEL